MKLSSILYQIYFKIEINSFYSCLSRSSRDEALQFALWRLKLRRGGIFSAESTTGANWKIHNWLTFMNFLSSSARKFSQQNYANDFHPISRQPHLCKIKARWLYKEKLVPFMALIYPHRSIQSDSDLTEYFLSDVHQFPILIFKCFFQKLSLAGTRFLLSWKENKKQIIDKT